MEISLRDLFEAGVHYGHSTRYWSPKMQEYIFGSRDKIHIIDLQRTLQELKKVGKIFKEAGKNNNSILFVGTKNAAKESVSAGAQSIKQYFVTKRWLGGILTNYKTIKESIKRLDNLEYQRKNGKFAKFTKKEALLKEREIDKLNHAIGGIRNMNVLPDFMFVVDFGYEKNAVLEAKKLGIPVIAVVDTNTNPEGADFIIPGNDDSVKSIKLYMDYLTYCYKEGQALYEDSLKSKKD